MLKQDAPRLTLIEHNGHLLRQLAQFIQTDGKSIYSAGNEQLKIGSVGAHVRHIIDHYLSFINAKTEIDYDLRARSLTIESNPDIAYDTLLSLCEKLTQVKPNESILVKICTDKNQASQSVSSSFARELCFLHSHTTHHMAIIRLLSLHHNVELPETFGKAASTQKFEENV